MPVGQGRIIPVLLRTEGSLPEVLVHCDCYTPGSGKDTVYAESS